jgi:hypothetical protein
MTSRLRWLAPIVVAALDIVIVSPRGAAAPPRSNRAFSASRRSRPPHSELGGRPPRVVG